MYKRQVFTLKLYPVIYMYVSGALKKVDVAVCEAAESIRSAGLFGTNHETGKHGLNLAAVLLLGRDDVIKDGTFFYMCRINNRISKFVYIQILI